MKKTPKFQPGDTVKHFFRGLGTFKSFVGALKEDAFVCFDGREDERITVSLLSSVKQTTQQEAV